jgi:hypothetical protein
VSLAMTWGLSPLDWRSHAIDEQRGHPLGVLKAECGQLLMMVTTLHEAPYGHGRFKIVYRVAMVASSSLESRLRWGSRTRQQSSQADKILC